MRPAPSHYFAFLEKIAPLPATQQTAALHGYLQKNPGIPQAYFKLTELALLQDSLDVVQRRFEQTAKLAPSRQNSLWALAKIHLLQQDNEHAARMFKQAVAIEPVPLMLLIDYLAFAFSAQAPIDWRAALPVSVGGDEPLLRALQAHFAGQHSIAADAFAQLPDSLLQQPHLLYLWGSCFFDLGRLAQADSLWGLGLKHARQSGDRQAEAQLLTSLAYSASLDYGKFQIAEQFYQQAEQIARAIDDQYRLQIVLGNHASIRDDVPKAVAEFTQAIEIAEKLRQHGDAAQWYMGLAQTYYFAERFSQALQTYSAGEYIARQAADPTVYVQILRDKGDFYYDLHQDSLARKTYQDVLKLARQLHLPRQEKSTRARLADDLLEAGEFEAARTAYIDYIDFLSVTADFQARAYWQSRVAESFRREGHIGQARAWLQQAVATARSGSDAYYENWLLLELAKLDLTEARPDAALKKCQNIQRYAVEQGYEEMRWQTLIVAGKAHRANGEMSAMLAALKKAAALIEETRQSLTVDQLQISYFSEAQQVYRLLVSGYLEKMAQKNDPAVFDTLFHYAQLTRGRTLNELGSGRASPARGDGYAGIVSRLQRIQRQMRDHPAKRSRLSSAFETARYALVTRRLRLAARDSASQASQHDGTPLSLAEAKARLASIDAGLLLYHIATDSSFVIVVTGDQSRIVGLRCQPDSLRQQVAALMAPFHRVASGAIDSVQFRADLAHRLYKQLFYDLEKAMPRALPQNLLIVPDIAVMHLPFEMLLISQPKKTTYLPNDAPDYADDFLLHRYTISYSPSLSILQASRLTRHKEASMLVFANPFASQTLTSAMRSERGWRFDALPFAEEEAQRIRKLLGDRATVFLRDKATKTAFFEHRNRHPIIHFATHAFADRSFDAFSGLVLATTPDSSDDGLLMGYEISELDLQADLVALSACETGHGQLVSGEGVLGLPRLFLGAGARSVLMTRWMIDDAFASALLPEFYRFYLEQGESKTVALARAKKSLLHDIESRPAFHYQHPFYWASYSLYGHPGAGPFSPTSNYATYVTIAVVLLGIASIALWRYRQKQES